ncbi:MAG: hypothetical protein R3265_06310, partial [Hyphomonas sp.]|nr:hypothetical protein [Hyphomonas sp.]
MRNILLIFRRDYLGYVKAWGFWLSLAAVPMFMIIGAALAAFAAQSSPVRYFAVVEPGSIYADAIEAEFQRRERADVERTSEMAERLDLPVMSEDEARAAAEGAGVATRKFIQVPAPADSIDGLRPYLLGERTVSGPLGDKPLFAAFVLAEDGGELEYWSDDVNVDQLR